MGKTSKTTKAKRILEFDSVAEKELLKQYIKATASALDKHFSLI